ncbi:hypothetical protein K431DRAFT_316825 [Polychaeton citri CBS 116435]|uniref:Heterokaryon incompatibility domain-containing protein n=1 Tax=Polychaeton citri CBS 116435 TaxID=1314669 RepID=A0A9P4PY98_9PEZI|nr:hypothetical protein K431DRAFT_316825 [Polychaeton citri CBS 116435]
MEKTTCSIYAPLWHTDSIRILKLTKSGSRNDQITGRLVFARLQAHPSYHALSYAWGDSSPDDPSILVNKEPLKVTPSLFAALVALTSSRRVTRLWVDQISINQKDDIEKGNQVSIMAKIFKQAESVIGWLGSSHDDSDMVFEIFRILSLTHKKYAEEEIRDQNHLLDKSVQQVLMRKAEEIIRPDTVIAQAAKSLLQRPWFHRLWIVQEVGLASKLDIRCGNSSIPGNIFFAAVEALSSTVTDPPLIWLQSPLWHAYRLGQLRERVMSGDRKCFVDLANELSMWVCKRDQDRLNALWGLVDNDDPATTWFKPLYTTLGPDMYKDFARKHIDTTGTLDVLHYAGHGYPDTVGVLRSERGLRVCLGEPRNDIPSWTPDWRILSRPLALTTGSNAERNFSATTSAASYSFVDAQLRVRALKVDTISVCGIPYSPSICRYLERNVYHVFTDWFKLARSESSSPELESAFAATLVMDGKVKSIDHEDLAITSAELPDLFEHWSRRNMFGDDDTYEDCTLGLEESTRYGNVAEEVTRNRRFFLTENGRMGLGPARIPRGASVYLIDGMRTPFVVRNGPNVDVLYGECYVHGIMQGEVSTSNVTTTLCFE